MSRLVSVLVFAASVAATIGIAGFLANGAQPQTSTIEHVAFDGKGNIHVPKVDYRKDWTMLGSWAVANDEGEPGSQGLHVVYTQPDAVEAYRESGRFPDGAVVIKELYSTTTEDMTTGTVSRAKESVGWFVMIKDQTGRFPDNRLWGDGWGWAYFDAEDRVNTTSTDFESDCKGCHVPAQKTDWIYVEGYPVLSRN